MLYCKPKFGEGIIGRGMGLGDRLFAWARCRIFAKTHHGTVISPTWIRPAVMQVFRGGIDYQCYLRQLILFGLFRKRTGDLGILEGYLKTRRISTFDELEGVANFPQLVANGKDVKIVFRGREGHFAPLNGWSEFLLSELRAITKPKYLFRADQPKSVPIGLVVRCGNDFPQPSPGYHKLKPGEKTPLSWFIKMLELIRNAAGRDVDAYVVSDGTSKQLAELLALKNVHFVRPGSAVSDLLLISRSKVLLASGSSSFSGWACFLGRMPAATHPGQPFSLLNIVPARGQFIGEVDPTNPSLEFVEQAVDALKE